MNEDNKIQYGWICPKCGAVMSPNQATCVFCAPTQISSLYNVPYVNIDYAKAISVTESHHDGRLRDKEGKQ